MKSNDVKKAFKDINVSKELENKVFNKTIDKRYSYKHVVTAVLVVCVLFFSIVYAKDIKGWYASIRLENGNEIKIAEDIVFREISQDAPKEDIEMNYSSLSKTLGFKILTYDKATNDKLSYRVGLNKNGNIGRVDVWWVMVNNRKDDNDFIAMDIGIVNKDADKEYIEAFKEGHDSSFGNSVIKSYKSDNLSTNVVLYKTSNYDKLGSNECSNVQFVYDGVLYHIVSCKMTLDEMEELVENLHY